MGSGKTTSFDIAHRAGVSQATVSRALRNSPLVNPETRERVQRIAREMNYRVDRNAAGLRSQQSHTIALLFFEDPTSDESQINPFFLTMLGHITRVATRKEYDVLISFQQLSDDWLNEYVVSNRADGIILLGYGDYVSYREKLDALADANTRFIIYGAFAADQPGLSLGCDNVKGGRMAADHLLGLGRRRIAILGDTSKRHPEFAARHDGYLAALGNAGIDFDPKLKIFADNTEADAYNAVRALLDTGAEIDGLFAVTDVLAIGALHAFADAGRQVPQDISVVGFDDLPRAAYVNPPLTTIQQNIREAGEGLVKTIVGLIEGEDVESTQLEPRLVVRQSCGA